MDEIIDLGPEPEQENPIEYLRRAIESGATKIVVLFENGDGTIDFSYFGEVTRRDLAFYAASLQEQALK